MHFLVAAAPAPPLLRFSHPRLLSAFPRSSTGEDDDGLMKAIQLYVKSAPKVSAKKSKQQQDKARKLADRAKGEAARARKQIKKKRATEKKLLAGMKQLAQALAKTAGVKRAVGEKLGRDRAKAGKLAAALAEQRRELRAIGQDVLVSAGGAGAGAGAGPGAGKGSGGKGKGRDGGDQDSYRVYLVRGARKLDAAFASTKATLAGEVRKRSKHDTAELDNVKEVVMGVMTPRA